MGDNSQNSKEIKKEKSKIAIFLKENIVIVVFFIVNLIVTVWFYFISGIQDGLISNSNEKVQTYISAINKAVWKIKGVKGQKIYLFKDKEEINQYEKALNKFTKMFWEDNLKIQISPRMMLINKFYLDNVPPMTKIQDYIYWCVSNWIKMEVSSYPIKTNRFSLIIKW